MVVRPTSAPSISASPCPKFKRLRCGEGKLIAEGDDAIDHADGNAADDQLREHIHRSDTFDLIHKNARDPVGIAGLVRRSI